MDDTKVLNAFRAACAEWIDEPDRWDKIAQTLNEQAVPAPGGEMWSAESTRKYHHDHLEEHAPLPGGTPKPRDEPEAEEFGPDAEQEDGGKILRLVHFKSGDSERREKQPKRLECAGKVHVEVQGSSKGLADKIESFLKRELRSLRDVEIDNDNPKWRIVVMATTQAGLDPVAFMYLVSETLDLPKHLDKVEDIPVKLLTDAGVIYEHIVARGVRLCPQRSLPEVCQQIVATFDTDVVEPARAARKG